MWLRHMKTGNCSLFVTLAPYLRDRYFDSQNKYKRVKEIISQEWQKKRKDKKKKKEKGTKTNKMKVLGTGRTKVN